MRCAKGEYEPTEEALAAVRAVLDAMPRDKGFGNGRLSRNLFEESVVRQASRLVDLDDPTDEQLRTVEAADVPSAEDVARATGAETTS